DGRYIASGSTDGTIKVWNRITGTEVATLAGHTDIVTALIFSADSKRVISGSRDLTLKVWEVATAKELPRQPAQQQNWSLLKNSPPQLLVSADGTKLFVPEPGGAGQEKSTKMTSYDLETGIELFSFVDRGREVRAISISTNGKCVAMAAQDGTV